MLGRPSANSTEVQVIPDEWPALHCPQALIRAAEYSSLCMRAYLLSDGTQLGHLLRRPRFCTRSPQVESLFGALSV